MKPPFIRQATPGDAPQIQAIYEPIVRDTAISFEVDPPSAKQMLERIQAVQKSLPWLVCEEDGELAGYVYASPHHERAAYQWSANVSVYIHAGHHRRGVARALYTSLFALLKLQGYYNLYAGVTLPNAGSIGLHESMGFQPLGTYRNVGYKSGAWHDVGWWSLVLRPHENDPVPPLSPASLEDSLEWQAAMNSGASLLHGG